MEQFGAEWLALTVKVGLWDECLKLTVGNWYHLLLSTFPPHPPKHKNLVFSRFSAGTWQLLIKIKNYHALKSDIMFFPRSRKPLFTLALKFYL